jgi:hypothetical protein
LRSRREEFGWVENGFLYGQSLGEKRLLDRSFLLDELEPFVHDHGVYVQSFGRAVREYISFGFGQLGHRLRLAGVTVEQNWRFEFLPSFLLIEYFLHFTFRLH